MSEEEIPLDKLAKVYLRMRDKLQELTREYESQAEEVKNQMDLVKGSMKDRLLALGATSSKTTAGTIILSQKTRYYAQDWDAMKQFIRDNDALDLFEKRLAQTNMATFLEQNPGVVPPGLQTQTEFDVSVRRPNAK